MRTIKKFLFVMVFCVLSLFTFTGCELNNNNLTTTSMTKEEVERTVKILFDKLTNTNSFEEEGSTDKDTVYGEQFITMMLDCQENNKIGYIDLYKSPTFKTQTYPNSTKDVDTVALLYYLGTIDDIALKIEITSDDAVQYLNNYYVYGDSFIEKECKYIADYYGIEEGVIVDSIVYHDGKIMFVFLKNLPDINQARNVALNVSPYLSYFRMLVEELQEEADAYMENN